MTQIQTKILVNFIFAVLSSTAILGCAAKGFNRGELKEQANITNPLANAAAKPTDNNKDLQEAYKKIANIPKPFKLAVYFKPPKIHYGQVQWQWTEKDRAILDDIGKELKSEGLVSEVLPITQSMVTDEGLKPVRLVATQHQADALLIISGGAQIDRYFNGWGWSYILLLPTLFIPGSTVDTVFLASATLWDVKNASLYFTAEVESTSSGTYPALVGKHNKELIDDVKVQALTDLKIDLKKTIKGTKTETKHSSL